MSDEREPADSGPGWLSRRSRVGVWGATTLVALLALGGAFVGGYFVGDDSARLSVLEDALSRTTDDLDTAEAEVVGLSAENSDLTDTRADLRDQLRAERSLNGTLPKPASSASSNLVTDLPWGAAATIGNLTLKPLALEQSGERWVLTVSAKNEGDSPVGPFCGDAGASLADTTAREFTGDSVLADDTANCGDDLQPGLTATYKAEFKMPTDAKPGAVAIYGDYDYVDEAKIWAAP